MGLPFFSALVTALLIALTLNSRFGKRLEDIPNQRSLHKNPVPRVGGIGLLAGFLTAWLITWQVWLLPISAGVVLLMIVSFIDDLRGISPVLRLLVHGIVAGYFVLLIVPFHSGAFLSLLLVIAVIWMTNLYNFMDGADGIAGGMTFFGFGSYALVAAFHGDIIFSILNGCVVASAFSFLIFNFHPARIFMGDSGSIPLGFLASAFGLLGWINGLWPFWFPLLAFAPFIADASVTLLKRVMSCEKIWEAHRSHYYQRLVLMGWSHRRTAISGYLLMVITGGIAIWILPKSVGIQIISIMGLGVIYSMLMFRVDILWQRFQKE